MQVTIAEEPLKIDLFMGIYADAGKHRDDAMGGKKRAFNLGVGMAYLCALVCKRACAGLIYTHAYATHACIHASISDMRTRVCALALTHTRAKYPVALVMASRSFSFSASRYRRRRVVQKDTGAALLRPSREPTRLPAGCSSGVPLQVELPVLLAFVLFCARVCLSCHVLVAQRL